MGTEPNLSLNEERERGEGLGAILRSNTVVMLFVLVGVIVIFSLINPNFLTFVNMVNIMQASVIIGLLSIGQTYLIIAGHIDLSCGSIAALAGAILASLMRDQGLSWPLALFIAFLFAILVGLVNATLVNVFELQPFIATLAMMSVCQGATYLLCQGRAIQITDKSFTKISSTYVLHIPLPIIIMIALFVVFGFILAKTVFGRSVYMIGGNATAAKLAGIKPKRVSTVLYLISAGCAAVAGAMYTARMFSALPGAASGAEFDAITAVVLGGVSIAGGTGRIFGVIVGILIMGFLGNGMVLMDVSEYVQRIVQGIVLILAVGFDCLSKDIGLEKRSADLQKGALKSE